VAAEVTVWLTLLACTRTPGDIQHTTPGTTDTELPGTTDTAPAPPDLTAAEQAAFDALVADVEADMATYGVPGAQIAVVLHGDVLVTASLGQRGLENDIAVDDETRFRWASLSKSVAAAVMLQLDDEGVLSLDDAPEQWIPTFYLDQAPSPTGIVLSQMLSHTAGLPDFTMFGCDAYDALGDAFVADTPGPQMAPPGAVWNYSNTGFALAGAMAEAATGEEWIDLVQERIFDPLGMNAAIDLDQVDREGNRAVGWLENANGEQDTIETDDVDCVLWEPPAGIWGTATDLGKWMAALLGDDPVLADLLEAHAETRNTPDTSYGYGMYVTERNDHVLLGHDGRLGGFSSAVYLVPDEGFGVAILVNGDVYPGNTALAGLDRFLEWQPDVEDWTTDPATWDDYAGSWLDPYFLGPIDVTYTGDALRLSIPETGLVDVPMTQVATDHFTFLAEGSSYPMTFWRETPDAPPRWWVYRYGVGEVDLGTARRTGNRWQSPGWIPVEPGPAWIPGQR
jgi:CubicO group peptidase (beta-lactamase class C family)